MNLLTPSHQADLFGRIAAILEEARGQVVRAINVNMVTAYWLIGREIVQALQGGDERAEYGKQVLENLSKRLCERYGRGYSTTNLKYFRSFYQAYPGRLVIRHPLGDESGKGHLAGDQSAATDLLTPLRGDQSRGFSPQLGWSHYRRAPSTNGRPLRAAGTNAPWNDRSIPNTTNAVCTASTPTRSSPMVGNCRQNPLWRLTS
jgi:hypothetical protein